MKGRIFIELEALPRSSFFTYQAVHEALALVYVSSVQLTEFQSSYSPKTDHFYAGFSQLSQIRPFESSGVMERAMGIEPNAQRG